MSKLNCSNCKYYDFNAGDGVDWCKLNHEETGICGNCDREFEDLEEAITHYDALVEENNTFLMENSKMAGELKDLRKQLAITEKALELACKDVNDLTQNQIGYGLCYECEHFDLCNKLSNIDELDLECEQVFAQAYKTKAKEMLENE